MVKSAVLVASSSEGSSDKSVTSAAKTQALSGRRVFTGSSQCFKLFLGQLPIKPPVARPPIAFDAADQALTIVVDLNQKLVTLRTV